MINVACTLSSHSSVSFAIADGLNNGHGDNCDQRAGCCFFESIQYCSLMARELQTAAMAAPSSGKGKGRAAVHFDEDDDTLPPPLASSRSSQKSKSKQQKSESKTRTSHGGPASSIQATRTSAHPESTFRIITATSRFPLAPIFALDLLDGVRQCLQSWTMRYVPSIDGVLVSFVWPPEILQPNAPLAPSSAYTLVHASWTGTVFRPQIGTKTTGRLSLATPSTISLLLHNLFNASISSDQIPKDKYEWDPNAKLPYSLAPAANLQLSSSSFTSPRIASAILPQDPSMDQEGIEAGSTQEDERENEYDGEEAELGCWVHKETREPLGGSTGHIEFTVVGLTIANSMISTHGSLSDDPLNLARSNGSSNSKKRKKGSESKSRKRAKQ